MIFWGLESEEFVGSKKERKNSETHPSLRHVHKEDMLCSRIGLGHCLGLVVSRASGFWSSGVSTLVICIHALL